MIFYKQGWRLCTHKIIISENGEQRTLTTGNLQWWEDFVEKWSHTTIDAIEELQFTPEQLTRLEHIKHLPEDFGHIYSYYVETGEILADVELLPQHPFNIIALKHRELASTIDYLLDVDFRLMILEFGMN